MVYKLEHVSDASAVEEHERKYGKYNDLPPNLEELTEAEFARSGFFTWCLENYEHRQPCRLTDAQAQAYGLAGQNLKLFYMNNTEGFAISNDYWDERIRYFRFRACVHEFRNPGPKDFARGVPRPRRCLHVGVCSKCGYVDVTDSSD